MWSSYTASVYEEYICLSGSLDPMAHQFQLVVSQIAQIFGRVKPWWITGGSPNFTIKILVSRDKKECKQTGIHQSCTHQKFLWLEIH